MVEVAGKIRVLEGCRRDDLPLDELLSAAQPVVLKGLVNDWELVQAGLRSDEEALQYLRSAYNGKPVTYTFGEPRIGGRPFYTDDFTALNCEVRRDRLDAVLDQVAAHLHDEQPPTYYVA